MCHQEPFPVPYSLAPACLRELASPPRTQQPRPPWRHTSRLSSWISSRRRRRLGNPRSAFTARSPAGVLARVSQRRRCRVFARPCAESRTSARGRRPAGASAIEQARSNLLRTSTCPVWFAMNKSARRSWRVGRCGVVRMGECQVVGVVWKLGGLCGAWAGIGGGR